MLENERNIKRCLELIKSNILVILIIVNIVQVVFGPTEMCIVWIYIYLTKILILNNSRRPMMLWRSVTQRFAIQEEVQTNLPHADGEAATWTDGQTVTMDRRTDNHVDRRTDSHYGQTGRQSLWTDGRTTTCTDGRTTKPMFNKVWSVYAQFLWNQNNEIDSSLHPLPSTTVNRWKTIKLKAEKSEKMKTFGEFVKGFGEKSHFLAICKASWGFNGL